MALTTVLLCSHRTDVRRCFLSELQWACKLNARMRGEKEPCYQRGLSLYLYRGCWLMQKQQMRQHCRRGGGEGRKLNPPWYCEPLSSLWGRKQLFYLHNWVESYDCVGLLLMLAETHFKPVTKPFNLMYCCLTHSPEGRKFVLSSLKIHSMITINLSCSIVLFPFLYTLHRFYVGFINTQLTTGSVVYFLCWRWDLLLWRLLH